MSSSLHRAESDGDSHEHSKYSHSKMDGGSNAIRFARTPLMLKRLQPRFYFLEILATASAPHCLPQVSLPPPSLLKHHNSSFSPSTDKAVNGEDSATASSSKHPSDQWTIFNSTQNLPAVLNDPRQAHLSTLISFSPSLLKENPSRERRLLHPTLGRIFHRQSGHPPLSTPPRNPPGPLRRLSPPERPSNPLPPSRSTAHLSAFRDTKDT